jgi:hypothetical protein
MDELRVIAATRGVFLRREARDLGFDDASVTAAVRAGVWVRVRRGAYTFTDLWRQADPTARHLIRARAVLRSLGPSVALSHGSATVAHGIATFGLDLSRVHVTRLDKGAGRTEPDVVHHEGTCVDGDVVEKDGMLLMRPDRAVLEAASLAPVEPGLVSVDSALHQRLVTQEALEARVRVMERWPFTRRLRLVVGLADARAESVGESRGRYLIWKYGLPAPELQFRVCDAFGELIGITDYAWPRHRLLGEFDGKAKYGRLLAPGQDPGDAVFAEKRREDRLREVTGWSMLRITWADLYAGTHTAARVRRLMSSAA